MNIFVDNLKDGKVVRVDVGHRLDLTAYNSFREVTVRAVDDPEIVAIVIDFGDTNQLFDSGKAVLMDLMLRAKYLDIPLRLVNVGSDISFQLSMLGYSIDCRDPVRGVTAAGSRLGSASFFG